MGCASPRPVATKLFVYGMLLPANPSHLLKRVRTGCTQLLGPLMVNASHWQMEIPQQKFSMLPPDGFYSPTMGTTRVYGILPGPLMAAVSPPPVMMQPSRYGRLLTAPVSIPMTSMLHRQPP